MKLHWQELGLIVTIVVASAFTDFRIRQFPEYAYTTYIPGVIDGSYGAPAIYRILVPFSHEYLVKTTGVPPATVWHVLRIGWFLVAFVAMFVYLQRWVSAPAALGGVAAVAATLPLTHTNSWAHADSIPELALFTLGCAAIAARRYWWFAAVLLAGTMNRETAGFLVLTYLFSQPLSGPHVARTMAFGALGGSVLVALRLWRGVEHYEYWQLSRNLQFLRLLPPGYDPYKRAYAWFIVALTLPTIIMLAARWSAVPADARRMAWSGVPLVATGLTMSSIIEPRIFLPLYPLLLPALMCVVVQPIRDKEELRFGT